MVSFYIELCQHDGCVQNTWMRHAQPRLLRCLELPHVIDLVVMICHGSIYRDKWCFCPRGVPEKFFAGAGQALVFMSTSN